MSSDAKQKIMIRLFSPLCLSLSVSAQATVEYNEIELGQKYISVSFSGQFNEADPVQKTIECQYGSQSSDESYPSDAPAYNSSTATASEIHAGFNTILSPSQSAPSNSMDTVVVPDSKDLFCEKMNALAQSVDLQKEVSEEQAKEVAKILFPSLNNQLQSKSVVVESVDKNAIINQIRHENKNLMLLSEATSGIITIESTEALRETVLTLDQIPKVRYINEYQLYEPISININENSYVLKNTLNFPEIELEKVTGVVNIRLISR